MGQEGAPAPGIAAASVCSSENYGHFLATTLRMAPGRPMTVRATLYDSAGKIERSSFGPGLTRRSASARCYGLIWIGVKAHSTQPRGPRAPGRCPIPHRRARTHRQHGRLSADGLVCVPAVRSAAVAETALGASRGDIPSLDVSFVDIVAAPNLVVTFRHGRGVGLGFMECVECLEAIHDKATTCRCVRRTSFRRNGPSGAGRVLRLMLACRASKPPDIRASLP
jgi:hypothetical protein